MIKVLEVKLYMKCYNNNFILISQAANLSKNMIPHRTNHIMGAFIHMT